MDRIDSNDIVLPHHELDDCFIKYDTYINIIEQGIAQDTCFFHYERGEDKILWGDTFLLLSVNQFLFLDALNSIAKSDLPTGVKRYGQMTRIFIQSQQQENDISIRKILEQASVRNISILLRKIITHEKVTYQQLEELLAISLRERNRDIGLDNWFEFYIMDQNIHFEPFFNKERQVAIDSISKKIATINTDTLRNPPEKINVLVNTYYNRLIYHYKKEIEKYTESLREYYKTNNSVNYKMINYPEISDFHPSLNDFISLYQEKLDKETKYAIIEEASHWAASYFVGGVGSYIYEEFIERHYKSRTFWDTAIIAVGVKLYEIKYGRWSYTLNKMELKELTFLNRDPWNGFRPYRIISRNGGLVIYSFGPDRKNDHSKKMVEYRRNFDDLDSKGDIFIELKPSS